MKDITWEQFQEANLNADQVTKDFINSDKIANLVKDLIDKGLPEEEWGNIVKLISYVKLGLVEQTEFETYFSGLRLENAIAKTLLECTNTGLASTTTQVSPKPVVTPQPTPKAPIPIPKKDAAPEPKPGITVKPEEKVIPQGKEIGIKPAPAQPPAPTGKLVGLKKEPVESSVKGMRTMRDDINRLRGPEGEDVDESGSLQKPFAGK